MINLAQLLDWFADGITVEQLKELYQIADAAGDELAMQLLAKELEKRK